jgi:hypothetical protein
MFLNLTQVNWFAEVVVGKENGLQKSLKKWQLITLKTETDN